MTIADKLTAIAENVQKVYDAGKAAGGGGGDSYYDTFWDSIQQNGARTRYESAFSADYVPLSADAFKPKYSFHPTTCYTMFKNLFVGENCEPVDFVALFEQLGIVLDTASATEMRYMFYHAKVKRVGVLDCTSVTRLDYVFSDARIETIEKLILTENVISYINTFNGAGDLKNLTIEGTIAYPVNFTHSWLLSVDSLKSIIDALKDYAGTGTTQTLTLGTTNLAKLTDEEKAIATQKGWTLV